MLNRSLVVSRWPSAGPRKGWSSSAMRVASMLVEILRVAIVDGEEGISNRQVHRGSRAGAAQAPALCDKTARSRAASVVQTRVKKASGQLTVLGSQFVYQEKGSTVRVTWVGLGFGPRMKLAFGYLRG